MAVITVLATEMQSILKTVLNKFPNYRKKHIPARGCSFMIRRLRPQFGISRLPRPKMDILVFTDFVDRGKLSATGATEGKITANASTKGKLTATVSTKGMLTTTGAIESKLVAAFEKLVSIWSKK